jgi:hypothetical protein
MRILVHVALDHGFSAQIQSALAKARWDLAEGGTLFSQALGAQNHTRLALACGSDHCPTALHHAKDLLGATARNRLRKSVRRALAKEIASLQPETLLLSAHQLGTDLAQPEDWHSLHDLLAPLCDQLEIIMHVDEPARLLAARYAQQVLQGRQAPLDQDLHLLATPNYARAAQNLWMPPDVQEAQFSEIQAPWPWVDLAALESVLSEVFDANKVSFFSQDADQTAFFSYLGMDTAPTLCPPSSPPAAAWVTRCRQMNRLLPLLLRDEGCSLPRPQRLRILQDIHVDGPDIPAGALTQVSQRFSEDVQRLCQKHPGLEPTAMAPDTPLPAWHEADPEYGFRATQYLAHFLPRIRRLSQPITPAAPATAVDRTLLSPAAQVLLPDTAVSSLQWLAKSRYAPRNDDKSMAQAPFTPAPRPAHQAERLIIACMKDEAPYILEWIAFHLSIGFDHFLVYTNGCSDTTEDILYRLQELGLVTHVPNDDWQGASPQQHALAKSSNHDLFKNANWVTHIDCDEFINIRCGNGTLDDLFAKLPEATNVAMTWRLFGHNGVTEIPDQPVIQTFDHCAPSYCPKPHTAWGYKTLTRSIGAYRKLGCHRPMDLLPHMAGQVQWRNGSGKDITAECRNLGWRSSRQSYGYDLVQLNHYALRSAKSYLVKRQRGRALHVDRTLGLTYWLRNDWNGLPDSSIQRHLPRTRALMDLFKQDKQLKHLHDQGLNWHRAQAETLLNDPDTQAFYNDLLQHDLTDLERLALLSVLENDS